MVGTVQQKKVKMLLVGTVPPKNSEEGICGYSPNKKVKGVLVGTVPTKKTVKRLLVGTIPPKSEEIIGRNSPTKK